MDKYISREEAIKELREVYENEYPTASGDFDEYASHDVPNVLRNIPAADVQPAPQWISVKERLPEIGKSILIHYPKWDGDEIQVAKLEGDGMMFDICGEFNIGIGAVTHWMPLPKLPKDGDTE